MSISNMSYSEVIFIFKAKTQNIQYSDLYTNATFSKTINVNLPVGTIDANADASMGTAQYNIPILIPPGTNGVAPSLSVSYNSMSGGVHLGQGWSINGLSAISRTTRNIYFDDFVGPIELNANDKFILDGSRLISISGIYGANHTTYKPEIENFSNITSYGSIGGGPAWFRVESKDGVEFEYGNSPDSKFYSTGTTVVVVTWRLNKIKYKDGNYIEFKYLNNDADSRIDEIIYTGNSITGQLPYNKIKFNYLIRVCC